MQLNKYKNYFFNQLNAIYPETEISSFWSWLTEFYLNKTRIELALNPHQLTDEMKQNFDAALNRLKNQEPIQYILGETYFMDYPFSVSQEVLIPRPETEDLVRWIIEDYREVDGYILDIGTGSGCIAIALELSLGNARVTALDVSEKALKIAKENAKRNQAKVNFIKQDILSTQALNQNYQVIVSNPPYVRELERSKMQKNVLNYEPDLALFVTDDSPLLFYDKIGRLAFRHLKKNGSLYFEINEYLAKETLDLLHKIGFKDVELKKDLYGKDRMIKASL
ncbi:peptide chain release factor N(5)-glutamine methyltransferase [Mesonia sp. HuA40]|uniref:peptide chain release factor N(5)-glutamine methyltransferase n=1 Tax=Mesonia sp. HuA40 TaxID=2602761 RepID=UPI0011CA8051|nr:peptide chain release factor N(5)-glutamine methyltransferase [Mesonia sp. HuA40]TXK71131.1 peptide chain release factor N(5)-glutamine methyltransferase [Mesonia sp. HuA40]